MTRELPHTPPTLPDPLTEAAGKGARAKVLVEEAAEGLSAVNQELEGTLALQPSLARAVEKNAEIEDTVQVASGELTQLNAALAAGVVERHSLETQLSQVTDQADRAQHAALHDALTGLPNRALFADRFAHGLAQAERHAWLLAVMFVDLDGFKAVNDRLGHQAGDAVLCAIAGRLTDHTRSDDTVSRQGGDEFLYLLLEVKRAEDLERVAQKLAALIEQPCAVTGPAGPTTVTVTASIGIALYPRDGTTPEQLIARADAAMYAAKRRRQEQAFDPAPDTPRK